MGISLLYPDGTLQPVGVIVGPAVPPVRFLLRNRVAGAGEHGYHTVWTPFATLCRHESASRGSDQTPANEQCFAATVDRAFIPWYGRHSSKPGPACLEQLPDPW
jgi:hypothetical protein